jgi:histone demethylase JARID1
MVVQTTRSSANATQPTRNLPPRAAHPRRTRKSSRTAPALDLATLKLEYDPAIEVPKTSRPMGLKEAPTFWPTEKEWGDPLGYIQSIADEGKKFGIIKVYIPVSFGWSGC